VKLSEKEVAIDAWMRFLTIGKVPVSHHGLIETVNLALRR
jgi:hypothetical protein